MTDGSDLEELFHAAAGLSREEREELLAARCAHNPQLLSRARALLDEDEQGDRGLLSSDRVSTSEERVGPYRLVEMLGEGGMGTVWLARQEEPVLRLVALKMIRLGIGNEEVVERFEAERRLLASLNHPGIAQIYEAGTAETGRPFFVMEYVPGISITEFCEEFELSTREVLELFVSVCDAVSHAHARGIVHLDLKPKNILVAERDGERISKVIDFGIAQALARPLSSSPRRVVGSYLYMAPERIGAFGFEPDIRTDIYSLGAALYEAVAGVPPHDLEALKDMSREELRAFLQEDRPAPPSVRAPASRSASLVGDIDAIVARAMQKNPTLRYDSVSDLRADLVAHLEDRPVAASGSGTGYVARKFVRRHRTAVSLSALTVAALITGLIATAFGLRAERHAHEADLQRLHSVETRFQRARAVADYLNNGLLMAGPAIAAQEDLSAHDLFRLTEPLVTELFAKTPASESAVRYLVGHAFLQLGDEARAREQLLRALALEDLLPESDDLDRFFILEGLLRATRILDGPEAAEPYSRQCIELASRAFGESNPELGRALAALLDITREQPSGEEALARLEGVLEHTDWSSRGAEPLVASRVLIEVGVILAREWEMPESGEYFTRLSALVEQLLPAGHPAFATVSWVLGELHLHPAQLDAVEAERHARNLRRRVAGWPPEHIAHVDALRILGTALAYQGKYEESEKTLLEVRARIEETDESEWTYRMRLAWSALERVAQLAHEREELESFIAGSWTRWRSGTTGRAVWWPVLAEEASPAIREAVASVLAKQDREVPAQLHLALLRAREGQREEARDLSAGFERDAEWSELWDQLDRLLGR